MNKKLILILCIYVLPPFLFMLEGMVMDLIDIIKTGMCPGHPTDIPPVPCTWIEYFISHSLTPFGIAAVVFFAIFWGISVSPAYLGFSFAVSRWQIHQKKTAIFYGGLGTILSLLLFYCFYATIFSL